MLFGHPPFEGRSPPPRTGGKAGSYQRHFQARPPGRHAFFPGSLHPESLGEEGAFGCTGSSEALCRVPFPRGHEGKEPLRLVGTGQGQAAQDAFRVFHTQPTGRGVPEPDACIMSSRPGRFDSEDLRPPRGQKLQK